MLPVCQQLQCASPGRGYLSLGLCTVIVQGCELLVPAVWAGHTGGWSVAAVMSWDEAKGLLESGDSISGKSGWVCAWAACLSLIQLSKRCWGCSSAVAVQGSLFPGGNWVSKAWRFIPFSCIYTAVVPDRFGQCKGLTGRHGSRLCLQLQKAYWELRSRWLSTCLGQECITVVLEGTASVWHTVSKRQVLDLLQELLLEYFSPFISTEKDTWDKTCLMGMM